MSNDNHMPDFLRSARRVFGLAANFSALALFLSLVWLGLPELDRGMHQRIVDRETDRESPTPPINGDLAAPVRRSGTPPLRPTEQLPVVNSLHWLALHQMPDGRWSLQKYTDRCKDKSCTGPGTIESDAAATAMGVLPLLAAGQTVAKKGLYRENLVAGIDWLIAHQAGPTAIYPMGSDEQMFSHGLACIALCECYGTSK